MSYLLKKREKRTGLNQSWISAIDYSFHLTILIAAVIVGTLYSIYLFGEQINPLNTEWLLNKYDPSMYFISWCSFKEDGWHWPLTFSESLAYPTGANISYTDIVPLWAIPLKALSSWLPDQFQYFGILMLFNFIMQCFWGAQLGLLFVPNNIFFAIASGILFLIAPPLTWRVHGHFVLTSQWIILVGIWCFFLLKKTTLKRIRPILIFQGIILFLVTGINAYFTVMLLGIMIISFGQSFIDKKLKLYQTGLWMASSIAIVLVGWFIWGLIPTQDSSGNTGYGTFSLNLLSLFDPQNFSTFIDQLPIREGQHEGFNYLGLGLFLLFFANFIRAITQVKRWKIPNRLCSRFLREHGLLLLLVIGVTLVSLSNKVALGSHVILEYPLPPLIGSILFKFRGSGRFFWVVHYLIILGLLVSTWKLWKPRQLTVLLPLIILFQFGDLLPLHASSTAWMQPNRYTDAQLLKSDVWQQLSENHDKLIVLPSKQCPPDPRKGVAPYPILEQMAVLQGLKTNSAYLPRYSPSFLETHCQQLPNQFKQRDLQEDTAYVVANDFWSVAMEINKDSSSSHFCQVVDGYILCQNKKAQLTQLNKEESLQSLIPVYSLNTILDFRGPDNSSLPYQAGGWSVPDPQGIGGTWTDGSEARLLMTVKPLTEEKDLEHLRVNINLRAKLIPFLTEKRTQQVVDIVVNGQVLDRWEFNVPFTPVQGHRNVLIPYNLIPENQPLEIVFRIQNPVSPKSVGMNEDPRLLSLNFETIELLYLYDQKD